MKRTDQQNNALHKFCREAAKQLNMCGLTIESVLSARAAEAINGVCEELRVVDLHEWADKVWAAFYNHMPKVEISWTMENFKEAIWHFYQEKQFGTASTSELTTGQVNMVYEDVNAFLGQISEGEIDIPFPSEDNL